MTNTLKEHVGYLSDQRKLELYQAAIAQAVHPGCSVMDLGCGTGVLGLMALRAGAGRVVFVEEGEIIEVARQTVEQAGFAGLAEFHRSNSFELALAEAVDLVVCDHVGYFGFDYGLLDLLADAKQRFLKPGGTVIPARLDIQVAPIESTDCRKLVAQWHDGSVPLDYQWMAATAANTKYSHCFGAEDLLAEPATLVKLAPGTETDPYFACTANFHCRRDGKLDGLAGFFNCQLHDDIYMTNSPLSENALSRPQAFLPLPEPIIVKNGDAISHTLMVRHADHIINWQLEIPAQDEKFALSTFNGLLLDQSQLELANPDRIAELNRRGRARQIVLSYCDGCRTITEIAARVKQKHPEMFPSERALTSFVTGVLARDTKE